jgi:hypothetical protein
VDLIDDSIVPEHARDVTAEERSLPGNTSSP